MFAYGTLVVLGGLRVKTYCYYNKCAVVINAGVTRVNTIFILDNIILHVVFCIEFSKLEKDNSNTI